MRNLPRGEQTPKKRSKGAGTPRRATNHRTRQASRYVFNPDGVFESCDARLRHVGGQFTVLDGNVSEVSSMSSTVRCWSPAVRRVVLGNTLAEVSSWTALSWCSRSWYVAVMCLSSASPSSAVLCPGPSSLFLTLLYGLCCDCGVTGDCLTVCLLFPSCCHCATTCSRMCPRRILRRSASAILQECQVGDAWSSLLVVIESVWFFDAENKSTAQVHTARRYEPFDRDTIALRAQRLRFRKGATPASEIWWFVDDESWPQLFACLYVARTTGSLTETTELFAPNVSHCVVFAQAEVVW